MSRITRRETLAGMGIFGTAAFAESSQAYGGLRLDPRADSEQFHKLYQRVSQTPLIDTHEHLIDESERLSGAPNRFIRADDWTMLLSSEPHAIFRSSVRRASYPQQTESPDIPV